MKITRVTTEIFDFDLAAEQKRLKSCFKGAQLKRQEAILEAFVKGDIAKVQELYRNLPRCKKEECWEHEFVGGWIAIVNYSDWGIKPISTKVSLELDSREEAKNSLTDAQK